MTPGPPAPHPGPSSDQAGGPGLRCEWAPPGHDAPAVVVLTVRRPCGHGPQGPHADEVLTCTQHADRYAVPGAAAERATCCDECGEMNRPAVVGVGTLAQLDGPPTSSWSRRLPPGYEPRDGDVVIVPPDLNVWRDAAERVLLWSEGVWLEAGTELTADLFGDERSRARLAYRRPVR